MKEVYFANTTLRDGEQAPGAALSVDVRMKRFLLPLVRSYEK